MKKKTIDFIAFIYFASYNLHVSYIIYWKLKVPKKVVEFAYSVDPEEIPHN